MTLHDIIETILGELPMIQLPTPRGPHQIGMRTFTLIDTHRTEHYATDKKSPREILVNVWYPAHVTNEKRVHYTADFKYLVAHNEGVDAQKYAYVDTITTNAYDNPPMADVQAQYPGIIFSPGSSSPATTYAALCEELASQGYIVFGINHPYMCAHLTFHDGHIVKVDPVFTDSTRSLDDWALLLDKEIETWVADINYLMHQLKTNSYERLDANHMGIFGHSFGGAAATLCAERSNDYKAVINIDGWLFGALQQQPYVTPYMFLGIERSRVDAFIDRIELVDSLIANAQCDTYAIQMKHANHNSFREYDIMRGAEQVNGDIPTIHSIAITRLLLTDFFGKYIKGENAHYIDGDMRTFPELIKITKIRKINVKK